MLAYAYVKHMAGEVEVRLFFGKRDIAEDALLSDALEILNEQATANPYEFTELEGKGIVNDAYNKRGIGFNPDFDTTREVVTLYLRDFDLMIKSHVDIST